MIYEHTLWDVEKLKLVSFDDAQTKFKRPALKKNDVTNKKYHQKIDSVRNDKIKKSLLELTKVFKEKWKKFYLPSVYFFYQ